MFLGISCLTVDQMLVTFGDANLTIDETCFVFLCRSYCTFLL